MQCYININMDNAAFDDGNKGRNELDRILATIRRHEADDNLFKLHDINGNTVGTCEIKGE